MFQIIQLHVSIAVRINIIFLNTNFIFNVKSAYYNIHLIIMRSNSLWLSRNTNKVQLCNRIYHSKVYWRLNMFRAAHRSSSGFFPTQPWQRPVTTWVYKPEAANTVWSSWWWAVCRSKHVEPLVNFGIINSITKLHLVGISTESFTMYGSMNIILIT
jgi:hypothetical protein